MAASLPRKIAVGVGIAVGVVIVLLVALVLIVNSGVATKRAVDLVLPSVSKTLGREITLKGADLKLFPNPRVRLAGLAVAGRPGEPSLADLESLDVEVGLWPLLRSLGKEIDVRAFTLVRPTVNLVRAKDGTWNYEGLGAKGGEAKPPEPAAPPSGGGAGVAVQSVRIEKATIKMIDRSTGKDDQGIALSELDLDASGVGPGLPFEARIAAAVADTKQNLHAQLSVARLPSGVPQAPQDWPTLQGSVQLAALALDRLRALFPADVGAIVRGGTVGLDLKLSTVEPRGYRLDGAGELKDVKLRGQAASGHFRFDGSWSPAKPDAAKVDILDLALRGPGVDLGGHASVETPPLRAWFVLTGPLLDLDAVMGLLPESPEQAKATPPSPQGEVLPEATRRQLQSATAHGTVAIGTLKSGRLQATDVKARVALSRGTLTIEQMDASVFDGKVSGAGTTVALSEPKPSWKLAANLAGLDIGQATKAFAGESPLLGKLDGTLDVSGKGTEWGEIKKILTGLAALSVKDGTLTTTALADQVLGGLSKGLSVAGRSNLAGKVSGVEGGKTTFKNLAGKFTVKDGFLAAQAPLKFATDVGQATLGGKVGLGGELALDGVVTVPKATLAKAITGVPLPQSLDVPLAFGGTLTAPSVSVRTGDLTKGLVEGQTQAAKKAATEEAQKQGKKALEGLFNRFKN